MPNKTQEVKVIKRPHLSAVFDKSLAAEAGAISDDIDALISAGTCFKNDKTTTVAAAEVNGQKLLIKRYNYKGVWHLFRHNCKSSRAKRCWMWGRKLITLTIPTPKPLAYIETYRTGFRYNSYLITEYLEGADNLHNQLKNSVDGELEDISRIVEQTLSKLEANGLHHGDLKPPNIMIYRGSAYVIDLDAITKINPITKLWKKGKDRRHLIEKLKRTGIDKEIIDLK